MAVKDWSRPIALATRLLAENGQTLSLRRKGAATGPDYAPIAGEPTLHDIVAVDLAGSASDQDGTMVEATEWKLMVSPAGIAPKKDDEIQIRGAWRAVDEVETFAPGGPVIYYDVVLKNG